MTATEEREATPTVRRQFPTAPGADVPASRRERAVAGLAGAALVLPAWLLGAWRPWALLVADALAAAAFLTIFAPVFDYRSWPPSATARTAMERLLRFPLFWLGLAIVLYGATAALNPWRALTANGRVGWYETLSYIHWLPHALVTPFYEMNAWRALLQIAPAWLVAGAIWAGVGHAGTLRWLMGLVAVNGALLGIFGLAEQISGTHEMFWLYDPHPMYDAATFFGSFVYAGHAAAWLTLALGAAAARLDAALRSTGRSVGEKLNWLAPFLLIAIALGEVVRPDFWVLACGGILTLLAVTWMRRWLRTGRRVWAWMLGGPALVVAGATFLGLVLGGLFWLSGGKAGAELKVDPRDASLPVRYAIAQVSAGMITGEPLFGWGPGSYRFIAPEYLKKNSLFTDPQDATVLRFAVNHAHNDWVQFVAEWGFAGASLAAAALGWCGWKAWAWRRVLPPESWFVFGAVGMVLLGAVVDFPLYNPAVLVVVGGLLAATLKQGELAARSA